MNVVPEPAAPFYDGGWRFRQHGLGLRDPRNWKSSSVIPRSKRLRQTVNQPLYPLHEWGARGLGQFQVTPGLVQAGMPMTQAAATGGSAPKILAASAPLASMATTMAVAPLFVSSSAGAPTMAAAMGSWAGPIGAGIGILVGVIAGLWAAHEARVAGAKAENQAINSAVQTWDQGMKAIFAAANNSDPSQNVSGPDAAQQVSALFSQFWAQMSRYMHSPGTADTSGGGVNCGSTTLNPAGACAGTPGGHICDKSCTATCCVGCQDLYPSMLQAVAVLNNPVGGTVQVCGIAGSSYGANARGGYTLTYTPPAVAGGGGGLSSLSSLFGAAPGSPNLLLWVALGVGAYMLLRG